MDWVAIDAMGGDYAPRNVIDGALAASRDLEVGVALVGPAAIVEAEIARYAANGGVDRARIRVVDAPDTVAMDEMPSAALRRTPGASIRVAAEVVARGEAAALFSAGHTGATVMAAHGAFGMLPGVDRPALAAAIPTRRRRPAILLDVGATVECRPAHLLQFAVMGGVYARVAFDIQNPRIGILSIGEEAGKGNELTREAHRLLKASRLPFIGNVEARDVYTGDADVIVCDGFTGNVALKISEGLVEVVEALLGHEVLSKLDDAEHGGAPLLGIAAVTVVGHGRSTPEAVRNGVAMAHRFASHRFIERVEQDIAASAT
jgi:glycerol-3-phosphate acyltransferase PlsX